MILRTKRFRPKAVSCPSILADENETCPGIPASSQEGASGRTQCPTGQPDAALYPAVSGDLCMG
jgi:hypothetical protein